MSRAGSPAGSAGSMSATSRSRVSPSLISTRWVPADENQPLFQALRAWRKEQAAAASVPAFVVFNDATLTAVAEARPTSTDELLELPGIGAVKAERFGPDLLRIVAEADAAPRG